jgi:hypothetical protein
MKIETVFWCFVGYMVLTKSRMAAQVQQAQVAKMNDPTNWGADQWARIYGDDLAATGGQHDAQSSLTPYGLTACMGFTGSVAR